jgi:hypothetical protein
VGIADILEEARKENDVPSRLRTTTLRLHPEQAWRLTG